MFIIVIIGDGVSKKKIKEKKKQCQQDEEVEEGEEKACLPFSF